MSDQETKERFSKCLEECMDAAYSFSLRLTRNPASAEDLLSESVTSAWKSFATLDDTQRFRQWLFRIMHNCFISDYRKKAVRPVEQSFDDMFGEDGDDDITNLLVKQSDDFLLWWGDPEQIVANQLLGNDIRQAIDELPEAYRETVCLVNVEGLSYDEAAEILGVPPGTVRSRMKRGRTLLQRALWEHARLTGVIPDNDSKDMHHDQR